MIAIPAIDIMNGSCTRLLQGDFARQTAYQTDPLDQAMLFQDAGIRRLHLVDLDGAREGSPQQLKVLEQIATHTSLEIDYGGGIRSPDHVRDALNAGATQLNLGTMLFGEQMFATELLSAFGPDKLIASVDLRQGKVAVKGWQEQTSLGAREAIGLLYTLGWKWFSVTDTGRDGTLQGVDAGLYTPLVRAFPNARIIGGGGVAGAADLELMQAAGLYAAIIGKAVFEGNISLDELKNYQSC